MTKLALTLLLLLLVLATHRAASAYVRSDIVGNRPGLPQQNSSLVQASTVDASLVNPWGLAFGPTTPAWIAANGASTLALISGSGSVSPLKVAVGTDTPTGLVFNPYATDFTIPSGSSTSTPGSSMMNLTGGTPSLFITATEQGNIWAWGSTLSSLTSAVRVASSPSSVFKGLAIAANGTAQFLCAADFANREVVVFDSAFRRINMTGRFVDPDIPSDFSPFNVANILGDIFVSYARQNASSPGDEQVGASQGFISVFDPSGRLVRRFASRDVLNAPWGMVLAPLSFGEFGGSVLVGNFGDGRIWAFNLATGQRSGQLRTSDNREIVAEGLWGMAFGNGAMNQPTNTLFFNAGINNEADGLFGRIAPAPSNATTPASA